QVLAGDAGSARRLRVQRAELALVEAVGEASLLLLLELEQVLAHVAAATGATVLAGRVGALLHGDRLALGAPDVRAQTARDARLGTGVAGHLSYILRRLGGRQPLWGTGVTSLMPVTSMPTFWI